MPVHRGQYQGAAGALSSRLHCRNIYSNNSITKLDVLLIASAFLSILLSFSMLLLFSKSFCFTILLRKNIKIMNILLLRIIHIYALATYVFHIWLYLILTKRRGDIEQNPGPKSNSSQSFSICHWNLNSNSAQNFIKIYLLNKNLYCHTQTGCYMFIRNLSWLQYFKSWWQFGNSWLDYDLFRADHPSNTKRGSVCIYYRNSLPLKILGSQYLQECIIFEITIRGKLCKLASLFLSPSQSQDDF